MTTNLLGSGLLAYRIWMIDRDTSGVVRVPPRSGVTATLLLRVLIDAAVLYTFALIALLLCYAFQSIGQLVLVGYGTAHNIHRVLHGPRSHRHRKEQLFSCPFRCAVASSLCKSNTESSEPRVSDVRRSSV
ncbi:hypothetical protein L210DRAFT_3588765 [Boletus edulis BED1]|uniref:Uncharacterized protein n=1 Tax=Boletus edulis BED1 TaxID=1328754 RepID=A0AAD4G5Y4_BOLED|nr:hypothetical protein L210DRAFT_3588765 [Boletus edulis BED1]